MNDVHFKEIKYGFEYGAMRLERIYNWDGQVFLTVITDREVLDIRVTPSGFIRTGHRKKNVMPENCYTAPNACPQGKVKKNERKSQT